MPKRVLLLVGTKKGAFILESDADRTAWTVQGPLCEGWPIHDLIVEPDTGALLAAGGGRALLAFAGGPGGRAGVEARPALLAVGVHEIA